MKNNDFTQYIVLPDKQKFYYSKEIQVIQRIGSRYDPDQEDYLMLYIGKEKSLFVYKNKWYFEKDKKDLSVNASIRKKIEKLKQKERLKNKYKNLDLQKSYSFNRLCKVYIKLTGACTHGAKKASLEIYSNLGLNPKKDKIKLLDAINESKKFDYDYNYLFTEWFEKNIEEEAE